MLVITSQSGHPTTKSTVSLSDLLRFVQFTVTHFCCSLLLARLTELSRNVWLSYHQRTVSVSSWPVALGSIYHETFLWFLAYWIHLWKNDCARTRLSFFLNTSNREWKMCLTAWTIMSSAHGLASGQPVAPENWQTGWKPILFHRLVLQGWLILSVH